MYRIGSRFLGVSVVGLLAPLVMAAPSTSADLITVSALTVTPAAVAVSGFGSVDVTIAATLDLHGATVASCSGFVSDDGRFYNALWVELTRTVRPADVPLSTGASTARVPLTVSGPGPTATSGTWTGRWKVAATRGRTWTVTAVGGCLSSSPLIGGTARQPTLVDPATAGLARHLTVTATSPPAVTAVQVPQAWPAMPLVRVTITRAGAPVAGRRVLVQDDLGCLRDSGRLVTTGNNGTATVRRLKTPMCWMVTAPASTAPKIDVDAALLAGGQVPAPRWLFRAVTATPGPALLRVGQTVTGAVSPSPAAVVAAGDHSVPVMRVLLQRLVGRTVWRTVATAPVGSSGRYTLRWTPPSLGRVALRVSASGAETTTTGGFILATYGPSTSRTMPVTVVAGK